MGKFIFFIYFFPFLILTSLVRQAEYFVVHILHEELLLMKCVRLVLIPEKKNLVDEERKR
jgi:hypothetical protein